MRNWPSTGPPARSNDQPELPSLGHAGGVGWLLMHASVCTTTSPIVFCCDGESAVMTKQPLSAKTITPAMPRARRARLMFIFSPSESGRESSRTYPELPRIATCHGGRASEQFSHDVDWVAP